MMDVPVDAQGNKTDPLGRGIDDFLRSLVAGAAPPSAQAPQDMRGNMIPMKGIQAEELPAPAPKAPVSTEPLASPRPSGPMYDPTSELDNMAAPSRHVGMASPVASPTANPNPLLDPSGRNAPIFAAILKALQQGTGQGIDPRTTKLR